MTAHTFLMLALALSDGDAASVLAYYESMNKALYLVPCNAVLPEHALSFDSAYSKWLGDNARLIKRGEAVIRAEVGANGVDHDSSVGVAQSVIESQLMARSPEERLASCRRRF